MSKGSLVYAVNTNHNHKSDSVIFVDTSELVSTKGPEPVSAKIASGPSISEPVAIAATIKQPSNKDTPVDLVEKMKQRLATTLGKKLQKQ